ncbi:MULTISPECIES: AAA family ATPase [unclassified Bradyrhizobium]|uniref:AAA family ATPase n=1 Tax=unclassified Bradyrhizobium TaxID=2631580 RepID=UPI0007C9435D|nr:MULTISPECIES: AAA family ATPase [unclassified Bradyrhizobium]
MATTAPSSSLVAHDNDNSLRSSRGPTAAAQEPPGIKATPFVWRDPKTMPRRQFLYGHHLIRKFGSATFAGGGIGKSFLKITEAVAMATGRALLGVRPNERCRVWYWNGEDPLEEINRRIAAVCLYYNIRAEELEGWLFVDSGRDQEIIIASQTSTEGTKIAAPVVRSLIDTIHYNKIDVLMVDPFISCHRVTENDNGAIDMVAKKWTAIADETNAAIELVHHVRKTGGAEATVEDGRGAVALLGAVRSAQVLNKMTAEEGNRAGVENPRQYFSVETGKLNLSPPPDGKDWFHITPVHLGNGDGDLDPGDSVGVVVSWKWPNPLDGVTGADFDAAAAAIRAGNWRHDGQAKEWVGIPIARAMKLDISRKADKAKVNGLVKLWIGAGALEVYEELDEKRMKRKFVRVADAT